jgi:hypothetical protein
MLAYVAAMDDNVRLLVEKATGARGSAERSLKIE